MPHSLFWNKPLTRLYSRLASILVALLLLANTTNAQSSRGFADRLDWLNFCDEKRIVFGLGSICIVKPSRLLQGATDFYPSNASQGYGYHVIAFPLNVQSEGHNGIHVHLLATGVQPHNGDTDNLFDSSTFGNFSFIREALIQRKVLIMPAYNNRIRVVNSPCGAEPAPGNALDFYGVPINVDYDDCAARYRASKLTGEPSLYAFGETLEVDSLFARLWSLATLLEINGFETGGLVDFNLATTQFSGHSQGAIFTYLMAKLFIVDRACVLAGPYDLPDNINPQSPVADWLTVPFFATDLSRVVTINHVEDTVIGHAVTNDTLLDLGLLAPENVVDVSDLIYGPGGGINAIRYHSATAYDAFYSDLRQSLCF